MLPNANDKYNRLHNIIQSLKNELNLTPCIGVEIEFYLIDLDLKQNVIHKISNKIGHDITSEKGNNQYEINLDPSTEIMQYADKIKYTRNQIISISKEYDIIADFTSKPFKNDYGNSMHVHLNFLEDDGSIEEKNKLDSYANILCYYVKDYIAAYLPLQEDYMRLDHKYMAPTHISYGGNNRTVLIRIPDSTPLRIEHRLPAASADPYDVFYAILLSIYQGLQNYSAISGIDKIYGNAYDLQYNLTTICKRDQNHNW